MTTPLRSLIWKEWHAQRWPLGLGLAWAALSAGHAVAFELVHRVHAPVATLDQSFMLGGLAAAILLAMRMTLSERTQRTLPFSEALPLSLRRQAWIRMAGALLTIATPAIVGGFLVSMVLLSGFIEQAPPRVINDLIPLQRLPERPTLSGFEAAGMTWRVTAIAFASSIQLLLLLGVLGAGCRTESQVGFLGACLAFVWLILPVARAASPNGLTWLGALLPQTMVVVGSYGDYGDLSFAPAVWSPLAFHLIVLAVLATLFVYRYGKPTRPSRTAWIAPWTWRFPPVLSRLPLRLPGRVAALVWLDLRQAVPMCLAGLILAVLITAITLVGEHGKSHDLAQLISGQMCSTTWFLAILWGALVGSAMFAGELRPGLQQFWRSRPISASTWFWVKFVAGLLAVLGLLDLVTIVLGWNSPHVDSGPDAMSRSYVACMPLLHALCYTLAVLGVCWSRRPVLSAFVPILLLFVFYFATGWIPTLSNLDPVQVYNELYFDERPPPYAVREGEFAPRPPVFDLTQHHYPLVYGGLAAITLLAALSAWRGALRPAALGFK